MPSFLALIRSPIRCMLNPFRGANIFFNSEFLDKRQRETIAVCRSYSGVDRFFLAIVSYFSSNFGKINRSLRFKSFPANLLGSKLY